MKSYHMFDSYCLIYGIHLSLSYLYFNTSEPDRLQLSCSVESRVDHKKLHWLSAK